MQITLNPEQTKIVQKWLDAGLYQTVDEAIALAIKNLDIISHISRSNNSVEIVSSPSKVLPLLQEKIKMIQTIPENPKLDPNRQVLAQEFRELCEKTQALYGNQLLTQEEIATEIDAYRRGE